MSINKIFRLQHLVILWMITLLFFNKISFSQNQAEEKIQVENVNWMLRGDMVVISYDLVAPPDQTYFVNIKLLRENVRSFRVSPQKTTGHVGKGKFAGTNRVIYWDYLKDVPDGLQGEDFYFEISAEKATRSKKWLYPVLGGVAAVTAIGTVAILSGNGGGGTEKELPTPPVRPVP